MMLFIVGGVVGFTIAALWQYSVVKKQREIYGIIFKGLVSDANKMAKKLGHEDLIDYYTAERGSTYAANAGKNIMATLKDFFHEDVDEMNI
jgi:hypothetical protein